MKMRKVKVSEFAEVITGGTPSTSIPEYWDNGTIPWLQSGACQNCIITDCDTFITQAGLDNSAAKMMKPDSVLIALTGATTGKVGYLTFEACANQSVTGIQPNESFVPKYLYYYLLGIRQKILDDSYGGAQKHISQGYVKNLEIPLGTITEQKNIVEKFDHLSQIISFRQQELDRIDNLIKARFVEMFGDPKKNNKNLVSIGSIGHLNSGGTPSRGKPEYFQGNIKWFTAGELNSLYLGDTIEHISEDGLKNSSAKLFKKGTLMIGMYDTAAFKMGILTEDSASNQACANLEPNDNYDVIWLYYVFSILKPLYLNERQGVRQQNLSLTKIKNLQFPAEPFDKQKKFADFVRQVDKSKVAVQKSLDETQLLFDSLMQKYFG